MDEEKRRKALQRARMIKLLNTVSAMRKAQKAFFEMRLKSDLQRSKMLEQEVDKQIQIIEYEEKNKPKCSPQN